MLARAIQPCFLARCVSADHLQLVSRRLVMIQTRSQTFDAQRHEIDFAGVPRTARWTGFVKQFTESGRIPITGYTPHQMEKLGYGFKRQLLLRESPMGLPCHQDSNEFGIKKSACGQHDLFRPFDSLYERRLRRLWDNRLQPIDAPTTAVDVRHVLGGEMEASFGKPARPFLCDPTIVLSFR